MRERGRRPGRAAEARDRVRSSTERPRLNYLSDAAVPNVLAGMASSRARNTRPSWVGGSAGRTARVANRRTATPAGEVEGQPGAVDQPGFRAPSWTTIIFTGLILFSLVRACLQSAG